MWGEGRLTPEFDAFGFRIGPAPRRALGDAAAFELRRNAKHGKDKLGEIARGIKHRLGQRTQARPGALHVAGDDKAPSTWDLQIDGKRDGLSDARRYA